MNALFAKALLAERERERESGLPNLFSAKESKTHKRDKVRHDEKQPL